mgnify:FL=1
MGRDVDHLGFSRRKRWELAKIDGWKSEKVAQSTAHPCVAAYGVSGDRLRWTAPTIGLDPALPAGFEFYGDHNNLTIGHQ